MKKGIGEYDAGLRDPPAEYDADSIGKAPAYHRGTESRGAQVESGKNEEAGPQPVKALEERERRGDMFPLYDEVGDDDNGFSHAAVERGHHERDIRRPCD